MAYSMNMSPISLSFMNESSQPKLLYFKKISALVQTISFLCNCAHFKKPFLNNFDFSLEHKSVSYSMVYTLCFEKVDFKKKPPIGLFSDRSFLTTELYCIHSGLAFLVLRLNIKMNATVCFRKRIVISISSKS